MDPTGGVNMDSSIYRDELRLLIILIVSEIGARLNSDSAQFSGSGFRHGKAVWMVLWSLFAVSSSLARHFHVCVSWPYWLWHSMAPYHEIHFLALRSGQ